LYLLRKGKIVCIDKIGAAREGLDRICRMADLTIEKYGLMG
jgi:hypothetical protein